MAQTRPAQFKTTTSTRPVSPAVCFGISKPAFYVLKKRPDFLGCAKAKRKATGSMVVQARISDHGLPRPRVGFTCSRKVGNAVQRNRAKRRLRAAAREVFSVLDFAQPMDFVLIGKHQKTAQLDFQSLIRDLQNAVAYLSPSVKDGSESSDI